MPHQEADRHGAENYNFKVRLATGPLLVKANAGQKQATEKRKLAARLLDQPA